MNPAPKAVAFDLDGTLAVSKSPVTSSMGGLLSRLLEKVPVAIMSGGSWPQFQTQLMPAFPADTNFSNLYLFPVCAGYCYHFEEGSWTLVDDNSFTTEERTKVMNALNEAMKETGFDVPPPTLWGERIEDRGALIAFSGLGQKAPWEEKKIWDPTREKRKPLQDALIRQLPDYTIKSNAATTIDITRGGIDKAYGVRKFSELLGIPVSEMLYVGDALFEGGNDEVVKETGIMTRQIADIDETTKVIEEVLAA